MKQKTDSAKSRAIWDRVQQANAQSSGASPAEPVLTPERLLWLTWRNSLAYRQLGKLTRDRQARTLLHRLERSAWQQHRTLQVLWMTRMGAMFPVPPGEAPVCRSLLQGCTRLLRQEQQNKAAFLALGGETPELQTQFQELADRAAAHAAVLQRLIGRILR